MCGIAGYVGPVNSPDPGEFLRPMIGAIAHRGPDGQGVECWPGVAFGHRRLAILDLSDAGRQPMLSEDRRTGVVFNGCIYNFQELRRELEQHGHRFRSNCDTEVLVRGYCQWGIHALVPRLRGMFAFAVWDEDRRALYLVRDRLGVKPLIYAEKNGAIAFASTVPALQAAGFAGDIDPEAMLEYLEFGYVTDDRAIYRGAVKVPAATIVEWRAGAGTTHSRYWTLPQPDEHLRISFDEAVEETERLLVESVRLRLISDVPVGALLSAGIDSSLVCWAMSKLNASITAFTVAAPGDASDESDAAAATARILGIPHQTVLLPQNEGGMPEQVAAAYGEPFGCNSALGMLGVSAAVKPHATVLLTGDGGDDVYLGYAFHRHYFAAQRLARALPSAAAPLWRTVRPMAGAGMLRAPRHFMDYVTGGLGAITRVHDGLPFYRRRGMLGQRLEGLEVAHRTIPRSMESARNLMRDFLDYQQRMWFVAEFMTKVDGGAMWHALEARSPFLDHVLWEFAAKLPVSLRLRHGELKAVLREIVRRRIGPGVATRRKQGFTVPVHRWLVSHWGDALEPVLDHPVLEREGWLAPGSMRRLAEESRSRGVAARQVWFLVVLEKWMRRHAAGREVAPLRGADAPAPITSAS